jgi:hypothetical protein
LDGMHMYHDSPVRGVGAVTVTVQFAKLFTCGAGGGIVGGDAGGRCTRDVGGANGAGRRKMRYCEVL